MMSVGFIVPFVAVSKVLMVMVALETDLNIYPIILAATGSLPIYLLDRVDNPQEDRLNENKSERRSLIEKYREEIIFISVSMIIFYISCNFLFLEIWKALAVHIHIVIFLLYSRTKQFVLLDSLSVAFAWSVFILSLVTFYTDTQFSAILFLSMLSMKIGETELSNIRDKTADEKSGNPTLPVLLDSNKTIIFAVTSFLVSILIILYHLPNEQRLLIGISSLPIIYLYATYKKRPIENTMYVERAVKISIGLVCFTIISIL